MGLARFTVALQMALAVGLSLLSGPALADDTNPEPSPSEIDSARVMEHVRVLSEVIGPRPSSSEAAKKAGRYIVQQLGELGLQAEEQVVGRQVAPAIDLAPLYTLRENIYTTDDVNVIVRFEPRRRDSEKALLLIAHYDTVWGSPGAVDNAASVGLLLELARRMQETPPPRKVILVWTAAEEIRLSGALALADKLSGEVALVVALDLIGAPGRLTLNGLSSIIGRGWLTWLAEVSRKAGVDVSAPIPHRLISRLLPELERSDHGPFTARGIPALHLYNRGDERIYLPYHTSLDTMARVDQKAVADAGRFITQLVALQYAYPSAGGDPGMWLPLPGGPVAAPSLAIQALEAMLILFAIISGARVARRRRGRELEPAPPPFRGFGLIAALVICALASFGASRVLALASSGHAASWVHAPGRFMIATALLALALAYGLAVLSAHVGQWKGEARYLVCAIALPGAIGCALFFFGAYELAWIFLCSSAALGAVGRVQRPGFALLWIGVAATPLIGPLAPALFREGVFNGFFPPSLPLAAYLAFFTVPHILAIVFVLRRWKLPLPDRRYALIGCGALALGAVLLLARYAPPCTQAEFERAGLACEVAGIASQGPAEP